MAISEEWMDRMVAQFRTQLIQSGLIDHSVNSITMKKWFDWAGLQRHLKCLGLFIRLARNGKVRYLSHCGLIKQRILMLCDQLPRYGILKIPVEMSV